MNQSLIEQNSKQERGGRTQFEAFIADEGILRLTEHHRIQAPAARYGRCESTLIRSRDTRSDKVFIALRINFKTGDDYKRESVSILDQDELTSLASALKYIFEHQQEIVSAAKTYTEMTYKSRGGFEAGFYIEPDPPKTVGEYMSIGGQTAFLTSLAGLARMIDDALDKIQSFTSE